MSRIDELIRELAPTGVAYVGITEVTDYIRGITYNKNDEAADGEVSVLRANNITLASNTLNLTDVKKVSGRVRVRDDQRLRAGDVLICAGSGSKDHIGKVAYIDADRDETFGGFMAVVRVKDSTRLDPRFVFHLLTGENFSTYLGSALSTTTINNLNAGVMRGYRIPVPPLEVQREIVRVLDQFTQLEAELEAELEARRRQYEHYRQRAMSFDDSIPRVALGDIAEVRSGWGFPNAHQGQEEGEYPFYKVSDMNLLGNETVMSIANHYVSAEVAKKLGVRPAPAGTVIFPKIGAAVATNKKRVLSVPSAYDNNVMGLVPTERVTSRFLYHWMQTFDLSRLANDSGAVPSIRKTEAEQVLIPLPDLDTQRKVADLLDRFDALVNDLNVGLPAELAARRKQYEYYRDNLLTFEEAAA
ncbi:restriction endonuclease subunit S [Gulosibacter massiliensis]|uniref:restriction endonuclease subunit S n=1 Tax=Gulosibacter massiliensis TaxID=2479839 RepID=UPI000F62E7E1|nr:restriction endonuclease subunit S [Gulosibacter massiliensis]